MFLNIEYRTGPRYSIVGLAIINSEIIGIMRGHADIDGVSLYVIRHKDDDPMFYISKAEYARIEALLMPTADEIEPYGERAMDYAKGFEDGQKSPHPSEGYQQGFEDGIDHAKSKGIAKERPLSPFDELTFAGMLEEWRNDPVRMFPKVFAYVQSLSMPADIIESYQEYQSIRETATPAQIGMALVVVCAILDTYIPQQENKTDE